MWYNPCVCLFQLWSQIHVETQLWQSSLDFCKLTINLSLVRNVTNSNLTKVNKQTVVAWKNFFLLLLIWIDLNRLFFAGCVSCANLYKRQGNNLTSCSSALTMLSYSHSVLHQEIVAVTSVPKFKQNKQTQTQLKLQTLPQPNPH